MQRAHLCAVILRCCRQAGCAQEERATASVASGRVLPGVVEAIQVLHEFARQQSRAGDGHRRGFRGFEGPDR